ncbi:MAG: GIY-YIG nuclease family protein [Candidatus Heimdallarchaeaceae archaeon]
MLSGALINYTYGLKGTYLLFLRIKKDIGIKLGTRKVQLESGEYIYVGSAFGTGGLSSRLYRHIRKRKAVHWHIDHITIRKEVEIIAIAISIGRKLECQIARKLEELPEIQPIDRVGNSDCRMGCKSHFFKLNFDYCS